MAPSGTSLVPSPSSSEYSPGKFRIDPGTKIKYSPEASQIANLLQEEIAKITGYHLGLNEKRENLEFDNEIQLDLEVEGIQDQYSIKITEKKIVINGSDLSGVFFGTQTLKQFLLINQDLDTNLKDTVFNIPCLHINDQPRYSWRGLHLDVSRHFFPVSFIKRFLDLMALYKFNRFHWHLTDDQGWRIEIKKYPRLTEMGSIRSGSPVLGDKHRGDNIPYGGYYTQEDISEIVAYASERYITVVPEIEMPGHSLAALAAYPEYGCVGSGYQVGQWWGMQDDVFCPGNEKLYPFLESILEEVMALFPGEFIHIGGDECPKTRWISCLKCQKRIAKEGLQNEDELQSYFIQRIGEYLRGAGRRLIGWDEIIEGGLADDAIVMSWRGTAGGILAAEQGHDVIMTPNTHCYFDHYQAEDTDQEPPAIGGFTPLAKVYQFDPSEGLSPGMRHHLLGGQGNIWTEYMPTASQVEYMAFPRTLALAEKLWTGQEKDFSDFLSRLNKQILVLTELGVNFRPVEEMSIDGS